MSIIFQETALNSPFVFLLLCLLEKCFLKAQDDRGDPIMGCLSVSCKWTTAVAAAGERDRDNAITDSIVHYFQSICWTFRMLLCRLRPHWQMV